MAWFLGLLGLSRIKFLLIAGGALALVASYGGVYLKGRMDCNAAHQLAELRQANKLLRESLKVLKEDSEQAQQNSERDAELQEKIDETLKAIGDGNCFTPAESERLRKLWD